MQKKLIFSYIQVALLIAAVTLGMILYNDLSDGPRTLHRSVGFLAAAAGIIAVIMTAKMSNLAAKITGVLSVIATILAGYAGSSIKSADNYDQALNLMRTMGYSALVLAIVTLVLVWRHSKKPINTPAE